MASTYSTSLKLELIGNGDQSGTWGTTTNNNLGTLLEQAITGVQSITMSNADYTLTNYNGTSDEARNAVLVVSGTNSAIRKIIAPLVNKTYVIKNATTGNFAITIGGSTGATVTIPYGITAQVYCDGTNFYSSQTGSAGDFTVNGTFYATGSESVTGNLAVGGTLGVTGATTLAGASATSLAVTGTTTLNTSLNGVPKLTSGVVSAATAGTDYVAPGTATTFTALQTFNGSSSVAAMKTLNIKEAYTGVNSGATGTINFDVTTQSLLYYYANAAGNWTLNFRGSSGTSLDSLMNTGETISVVFMAYQAATTYYANTIQVDGTTRTVKWANGNAPSAGNTYSTETYTFVIMKTATNTFDIFATLTKFA